LFIVGFGAVFVLLGVSATSIGEALFRNHLLLTRISGVVVLVMALLFAGSILVGLPIFSGEARFHPSASRFGPFAAPIAGAAFGFGWTPCIGPVLASVLAVAATERGVGQGAALLAVYAAGLGVPFLVLGCGLSRLSGAVRAIRSHTRGITLVATVLLAAFGVLLILNRLTWVTTELESAMRAIGLGRLVTVG
jgi:cytochrome c-type biogenesis protein